MNTNSIDTPSLQSRRMFLRQSAGAAAGVIAVPTLIPSSVLGGNDQTAPSNRITVGFIGVGSHGTDWNLPPYLNHKSARVVAVCDVDSQRMTRAKGMVDRHYQNKDCFATQDFREILARKDPYFPVDIGHRVSTVCHLANIAIKTGRKLRWDPVAEKFPDDEEANKMLDRPRRDPWQLPNV